LAIIDAVSRVLPVLLLFGLGAVLRRRGFFAESTVADLRRFVLAVTLPSALFLTFLRVSLDVRYLPVVVLVFSACVLMLLAGPGLARLVGVRSPYAGPLMTGFEAGMLGYAIYGGVFGPDALYRFGIVDLGQVLFVFFVLVPGLGRMTAGAQSLRTTVVGFLKTPVILAILGGLLFHAVGLTALFRGQPVLNSVLETVGLLGAMTTPLVALVIGYELEFRPGELRGPLLTEGIRLLIWVPAGLLFAWLVVGGLLGLDTVFQAAVATMVLLPAPFVIPIFMREASEEDTNYVVNTLTLGTLVTLFAYALVPLLFPPA
jgi:hypothetical protein